MILFQAVINLATYNQEQYWTLLKPNKQKTSGCYDIADPEKTEPGHIYVNRLVFSGTFASHLFLYGARLLHRYFLVYS